MPQRLKLAIFATHPIQYQIPWFQKLTEQNSIDLKVYYFSLPSSKQQGVGFDISFKWDIPLFEGYKWEEMKTNIIRKTLENDKPDIVLLTGWFPSSLLLTLWNCIVLKIPRMIRGDSNNLKARPFLLRCFHRLIFSQYQAFLAVGKANRDLYLDYKIKPRHIFFTPHFVDNERLERQFGLICNDSEKIRSAWSIPHDSICFLFAGKLIGKKRIFDLLRALEIAKQKNSNIYLLVVGTGELMQQAQQIVSERSLAVTFAGFLNQTEITRAYTAADCLVLPSDYGETWGLVVNEAMVCGLPAIVSDRVGCGPDLVEEGITGSVFTFGDIEALADRLLKFASDRNHLIQMGQQAKERIQSYSVDKAVEGTLQAIDYVLHRQQGLS